VVTAVTYLGSIGLGMLLVAIGLLLVGGDSDVEADGGVEAEGDAAAGAHSGSGPVGSGLSVLSMAGIGALLVGFGATGYTLLKLNLPVIAQVLLGLVGAVLVFRLTAWVKRLLVRNLESGSSEGEGDLVFRPGTVSVPIPAGGRGRGQVLVRHGIKTFYVAAVCHEERELTAGEPVVITGVSEGVYTVEPYQPVG